MAYRCDVRGSRHRCAGGGRRRVRQDRSAAVHAHRHPAAGVHGRPRRAAAGGAAGALGRDRHGDRRRAAGPARDGVRRAPRGAARIGLHRAGASGHPGLRRAGRREGPPSRRRRAHRTGCRYRAPALAAPGRVLQVGSADRPRAAHDALDRQSARRGGLPCRGRQHGCAGGGDERAPRAVEGPHSPAHGAAVHGGCARDGVSRRAYARRFEPARGMG